MKVVHIEDEHKLEHDDKEKVSILKLVEEGRYLPQIGIRDGDFFLLTETKDDENYLGYVYGNLPRDEMLTMSVPTRIAVINDVDMQKKKKIEEIRRRLRETPS